MLKFQLFTTHHRIHGFLQARLSHSSIFDAQDQSVALAHREVLQQQVGIAWQSITSMAQGLLDMLRRNVNDKSGFLPVSLEISNADLMI